MTKKLGLSGAEFEAIMSAPIKSFRQYRSSFTLVQALRNTVNRLRGAGWYPR